MEKRIGGKVGCLRKSCNAVVCGQKEEEGVTDGKRGGSGAVVLRVRREKWLGR